MRHRWRAPVIQVFQSTGVIGELIDQILFNPFQTNTMKPLILI